MFQTKSIILLIRIALSDLFRKTTYIIIIIHDNKRKKYI